MDRIPIMKPGIYHVRISYNKKILSDHRFIYRDRLHPYYITPFRVSTEGGTSMKIGVFTYQIEPRAGPVSGDTQILIHGRNLAGGDNYKCKFDGIVVPAWFKFSGGTLAKRHWWHDNWVGGQPRGVGEFGGGGRHGQVTCFAPHVKKPGRYNFVYLLTAERGLAMSI